ncbi:MAG: proliferation-associated 2G4, 38kDa [Olpidium bornovanus]|uniref:Proliferation-associated 2G4, 38kDa n=1 Tax=Olpidium bornovanus TaxID=278681 RepID=A0A8H7ZS99_9FUNG|nr:MAG: proliferation-associated 2G4, 38kDa [Olpidium bornovanus]
MSPLPSDPESGNVLEDGDLVKMYVRGVDNEERAKRTNLTRRECRPRSELGAQIDGYNALLAHSLVVGASKEKPVTGRKADVLMAAYQSAEAALRLVKPGNKVGLRLVPLFWRFSEIGIKQVYILCAEHGEGMLSHQQERNVPDGKKQIILNPSEAQRKEFDRAEFAEGEPKDGTSRTTVYKKTDTTYLLKMKASRTVFNEVTTKFGQMPFTLRAMEDEKTGRMGIMECAKHGLVTPYPVFTEKDGKALRFFAAVARVSREFVAQFLFTVLLMPGGQTRITSMPFDLETIKTDKLIEDEAIKALLAKTVSTKKKNKSKKKKKATSAGKAEAEECDE